MFLVSHIILRLEVCDISYPVELCPRLAHKPLHAAKAKQFLREIDDEQIQLAMMADSAAIELELPLN